MSKFYLINKDNTNYNEVSQEEIDNLAKLAIALSPKVTSFNRGIQLLKNLDSYMAETQESNLFYIYYLMRQSSNGRNYLVIRIEYYLAKLENRKDDMKEYQEISKKLQDRSKINKSNINLNKKRLK